MKKSKSNNPSFASRSLIKEIRELIVAVRTVIVRNVDSIQVMTYYTIGGRIVHYEQQEKTRAGYGEKILDTLSRKLVKEFGKGFSLTNLKLMRQFYLSYSMQMGQTVFDQSKKIEKSQTMSDQFDNSITGRKRQLRISKPAFVVNWSDSVFCSLRFCVKTILTRRHRDAENTVFFWRDFVFPVALCDH